MAIYLESFSSMVHFFNHVKELEQVITVPNAKAKIEADFFLQWLEIYGYTQFEMRRKLVCKLFFHLKLWHDKIFNRHIPAINHPVELDFQK